jgi:hypothetical protein
LKETKNSYVDACNDIKWMSGALDWARKETEYCEKSTYDEIPGMTGVWDWVLKETPRAASSARTKRWANAGVFEPDTPRVWNLGV